MTQKITTILEEAGVRPTANRIIVLKALLESRAPISLIELEEQLQTLERSSILRVLSIFKKHSVVHAIEDGRGVVKYEMCHGDHSCSIDDMHPHFYCERCERVFCFDQLKIPTVDVPDAFVVHNINYMLKGLCPDCSKK